MICFDSRSLSPLPWVSSHITNSIYRIDFITGRALNIVALKLTDSNAILLDQRGALSCKTFSFTSQQLKIEIHIVLSDLRASNTEIKAVKSAH